MKNKMTPLLDSRAGSNQVARAMIGWFFVMLPLAACSPKIYVIDNQTVLEEEAAGAWPQFEKQIVDKASAKGPDPIAQLPPNQTRERLYNVLNGEMPIIAGTAGSGAGGTAGSGVGGTAGSGVGGTAGSGAAKAATGPIRPLSAKRADGAVK